jgi:hypothetical protein
MPGYSVNKKNKVESLTGIPKPESHTPMKTIILFSISLLLVGCSLSPQSPSVDAAFIRTMAANTVIVQMTQGANIPTDTPIPPSATALPASPTSVPASPTSPPTLTATSTPDLLFPTAVSGDPSLVLGPPTWTDSFSSDTNWTLFDEACFSSVIADGKYVMTGKLAALCWEVSWPRVKNFYLNALAQTTTICPANGSYGLLFRAPDPKSGYIFRVTCEGKYMLSTWDGDKDEGETLIKPTSSSAIRSGPNQTNLIGVMAQEKNLSLYVNGIPVAVVEDSAFSEAGLFGFAIRGGDGDEPITVNFDEINYWELP